MIKRSILKQIKAEGVYVAEGLFSEIMRAPVPKPVSDRVIVIILDGKNVDETQ